MKIVIYGGTTEGRVLSRALARMGAEVAVCVATPYGAEEQGETPGVTVLTGRRSEAEKQAILQGAALCVDATHPYATGVTKSVQAACAAAEIPYRRLLRAESEAPGAVTADSAAEAAAYLAGTEGNVLLTTGAKELPAFAGLEKSRLYPRVLPSRESLAACEAAGIPHRNIIAMQGPFSAELNAALMRQFAIRFVVTKDGGAAGGFPEKAQAARETGATLIVLRRPAETGASMEEIIRECEGLLKCE